MTDLYSTLTVLRTESKDDLTRLFDDISQDIEPTNSIEKIYVSDIVSHTWDIMRYRRVKTGLLRNSFRTALAHILFNILLPHSYSYERWSTSESLAFGWLQSEPESTRRVLSLLREAGLDESAIEAGAYKLAADNLEKVDPMLSAAHAGRDKALRSIAKYRKSFADQLRRSSDRVLAVDEVPSIANDAEE